ncbi:pantoate-beta-alanine ligase [Helicobacter cinaedi PAGU611]|uniref:Pantothenate synthetase n=1 Tax=Helicobacter cinaedi CCUG 18818 = ATCC BAA-847 TaxID=537971 RepID=A0AAI8MNW9_9HELI|nr:pantoate--beta-alanine ligase [Helicobacter cinaedi]EFR46919.1 pantoate--beta-alanine ligase [Helicobacter cinaedi CCUG 18818 = ATCC BAA-847]QOQ91571.1 pantoate--beta-alanine ligase [Helicobacter cinaedi]BAM12094.1 pantoate-beta-alanine ligase [Helicobacter cinaedi PAGU611]BAM32377.1 pantoate-beta-alanine ligase [Helicobacter cinaedi CCUG 18818 = ATCC BAA-847]BBB19721.1 pantoate--beta-alanine ligase [Helicobacter cinaedi]
MEVCRDRRSLREFRSRLEGSVGFVATMGALHKGHLSLIEKSLQENKHTIISIFVNPTQFGENEDFGSYPRTLEADLALCKKAGVSAVFTPSVEDMYSTDEITFNPPKNMGYILEGFDRPTHFAGVIAVVLKLFMLVQPYRAYFGQKDAQQVLILQKMVRDLFLNLEIVPCEIMRDDDGLALSSRNIYLSQKERETALCIPRTIALVKKEIDNGEVKVDKLKTLALESLTQSETTLFYADFFNRELKPIAMIEKQKSIFLIALKVGKTRLLDNLWI